MPKVSVVIPTRNRADMLYRAICSVLNQSYVDFEVIVVSDASEDNTEEVVKSFDDPRIRFIQYQRRGGASATRNAGMRVAKGQYIAFLDDDDEWASNKLEVQVPVIEASGPEVGLIYGWMEYFEGGKSVGVRSPKLRGDVFVDMLDKQAIGGCPTIIMKREVIDRIGYFDESLPRGNDGDYWRRICKHYHVDFVPQILAKVSITSPGRISTDSRESLRNHIKSARTRLSKFRAEFDNHPEAEARLLYDIMKTHVRINEHKEAVKYIFKIFRLLNLRFSLWLKFLKKILRRK